MEATDVVLQNSDVITAMRAYQTARSVKMDALCQEIMDGLKAYYLVKHLQEDVVVAIPKLSRKSELREYLCKQLNGQMQYLHDRIGFPTDSLMGDRTVRQALLADIKGDFDLDWFVARTKQQLAKNKENLKPEILGDNVRLGRRRGETKPSDRVVEVINQTIARKPLEISTNFGTIRKPSPNVQTQQADPPAEYMAVGALPAADVEAERERQKKEMKERIEAARRRKIEEEARLELEKKERIAKRLAALPPLPTKDDEVAKKAEAEVMAKIEESKSLEQEVIPEAAQTPASPTISHSPPKPPQPLATGKPQQYGLMKVHPLDAMKKMGGTSPGNQDQQKQLPVSVQDPNAVIDGASEPAALTEPMTNGVKATESQRQAPSDSLAPPEAGQSYPKPASAGTDTRGRWGDIRDHRSPPSSNLWGISSNKALGNGTFDQGLAGYAPQDLSRTSSSGQGWLNGRTPNAGRSPQQQYATQQVNETRPNFHQPLLSPDQTPLAADSEADELFPMTRPAPIAPPQAPGSRTQMNGMAPPSQVNGNLAAWNNFQHVAGQQERAENDRHQREVAAKKEEEIRTGVRQGPGYSFNETWKQVQLGDQANQRHLSNVHQTSSQPATSFGAVGSIPSNDASPRLVHGQPGRGSRFFPPQVNGYQDRRAVTYSHPQVPRSPSPPPAEEYASYHPAFDGDFNRPSVKFPRAKPVVKMPSAQPEPVAEPVITPTAPSQPMSWAARAAMPAPPPPQAYRSASTPIVQNPSWQERFNGLLGKRSESKETSPVAPSAVAAFSREPLEVLPPAVSAAVSMPQQTVAEIVDEDPEEAYSKEVEAEEDLFEDRDMASLPKILLPVQSLLHMPLANAPTRFSQPIESSSVWRLFLTSNPTGRDPRVASVPLYAMIRLPGSEKIVKKDLPMPKGAPVNGVQKNRNTSSGFGGRRPNRGGKSRQASKAH